jgi:hypothetical protein
VNLMRRVLGAEMVPTVVHSLPGRVRLRIPALTRIPPEHHPAVEARLHGARLPVGLVELQVRVLSGSVLVRYDPDDHDESTVVAWVEAVVQAVRAEIDGLLELAPERRATAAEALRRRLEQRLALGRPLTPELLEVEHVRPA